MSASSLSANITLLPGDGVGPEVVRVAVRVLAAVAEARGWTLELREALVGGAAIDERGTPLPSTTIDACLAGDAVLLGAVGGPRWEGLRGPERPEAGLLALRRALDAFANVRPVRAYPALAHASPLRPELVRQVDLVVVRELTGGIYFGDRGRSHPSADSGHAERGQRAYDVCEYTESEIERVARVAGTIARGRRGRVTSVDKANVLETSRLWREVVSRVFAAEFADVTLDHALVDSTAMKLVQRPADFDVILTENMFGDILSDEAAVLAGSIGLLPSASFGTPEDDGRVRGLYEPIHGSAPDIAGKGIANPIGTILSAAMLLRHSLGQDEAAREVERAVDETIEAGVLTPDVGGSSTTQEVGEAVIDALASTAQTANRQEH